MNPKRLHQRWEESLTTKVAAAQALLRRRHPLTEPEVHDLRVALRRARSLAEIGVRSLGKTQARRFRKAVRTSLDALNQLRDCDVALEWLRLAGATTQRRNQLKLRRDRLWVAAKRRLKPKALTLGKLNTEEKTTPRKLAKRLEDKVAKLAQQATKTARQAPDVPIEELHKLRRVVRRWRYLRELQLAQREIRRDRRLKTLIQVQEALGALQNDEVILAQLKSLGRAKDLQELQRSLQSQFTHHHREALQEIKVLPSLA
jgi:CHAD domain-containing protein